MEAAAVTSATARGGALEPRVAEEMLKRTALVVLALGLTSVFLAAVDFFDVRVAGTALPVFAWMAVPITLFVLAYRRSEQFHSFVLAIDLRLVVLFQFVRLAGFAFLVYWLYDQMPAANAFVPALWDIAIAYSALAIAFWGLSRRPFPKRAFIAWNVLGIADFVVTALIFSLVRYSVLYPSADDFAAVEALVGLPIALLPTFMVPLTSIMHVIAILHIRHHGEPRVRSILTGDTTASART